jgi:hypothetical protein
VVSFGDESGELASQHFIGELFGFLESIETSTSVSLGLDIEEFDEEARAIDGETAAAILVGQIVGPWDAEFFVVVDWSDDGLGTYGFCSGA